MPTVASSRLVSSAVSYPMTTAFLAALRACVSRNADGSVRTASGGTAWCTVDASGAWAVGGSGTQCPISAETWTKLRASPHPVALAFVAVTFLDTSKGGVAVSADPSDPPDPS